MTDNIQSFADTPQGYRGVRRSKARWLLIVGLVLFALLQFAGGIIPQLTFRNDPAGCDIPFIGCDLRLRRNEVFCAHLGVNSFRIWNREVSLPGFVPWSRPDKEDVPCATGDLLVHSYPPWHHAFFYFYGWLSARLCTIWMAVVYGFCLCFIVSECARLLKARFDGDGLAVRFALSMIIYPAVHCLCSLNYGILILAAFLLMNRAREKGHDVAAGLCWAVMMIKPQVGLLFVWPLFWHRHYRTIITATVTCLAGTLFTSLQVHESMIDLILQIPQIGKPYGTGSVVDAILKPVFGENISFFQMSGFFVLTGLATWFLRRDRDFLLCSVPAALAVPLWTYSNTHDLVILLPLYMFLSIQMFGSGRIDKWKILGLFFCAAVVLMRIWSILVGLKIIAPTGIGWIFRFLEIVSQLTLAVFVVLLIRETWRTKQPREAR